MVSPSVTKTTLYLGGAVYENDVLQFLGHEEGRIRYKPEDNSFQFDYMIKDHLGNVRMLLTEEEKVDIYPAATLEGDINTAGSPNAVNLEQNYYTIEAAKIKSQPASLTTSYTNENAAFVNPNPSSVTTATSAKMYELKAGGTTAALGLGITLKVMSGDRIDITGRSYWNTGTGGAGPDVAPAVLDLLTALLGSPTGAAAGAHATAGELAALDDVSDPLSAFFGDAGRTDPSYSTRPRAAINYIFLDEQFEYDQGGFSLVSNTAGLRTDADHLSELQNLVARKNGYVYIYCSNESQVEVFFDNLQVKHTRGRILEESHYYPFGLTMAGISSKALAFGGPENKYKFNDGTELASKEFSDGSGLDWYETTNRGYDAQIGRFHQVDPLADWAFEWSPYAFANNNPILLNDPSGLTSDTTKPEYINTPDTAPVLEPVVVQSKKQKLEGGANDGQYFGDIKEESFSAYGYSSTKKKQVVNHEDFIPYVDNLRKELGVMAKAYGWGATLSGGGAFDLKSVKDYKDIVKKMKNLKKSDMLKINGLWMSIGTILAWRSSQFSDMNDALIDVLIKYNSLHASDPSGQRGIYIITSRDFTGTMGGVGGHEEVRYYDIDTKKYLGGTTFRL